MIPTKSNPYHMGFEDAMRGVKKNPYLKGTIQWTRYFNGQDAARQVRAERQPETAAMPAQQKRLVEAR